MTSRRPCLLLLHALQLVEIPFVLLQLLNNGGSHLLRVDCWVQLRVEDSSEATEAQMFYNGISAWHDIDVSAIMSCVLICVRDLSPAVANFALQLV